MTENVYFVGSKFEDEYGFSKAKKHGDTIYVSGSSGYNYETQSVSEDAVEQLRQAFKNIESALNYFGSDLSDLLQVQIFYNDQSVWDEIGPALGEFLKPGNTTLFAGQSNMPYPEFKLEIAAIAAARS